MAIRPARMIEAFALVELLREQYVRSRYVGVTELDPTFARRLLAQAIQRHGQTTDGGTLVNVIEGEDGAIAAFMVGVLNRIYHVGTDLCAQDMFLVAGEGAPALAAPKLLSAYIQWAGGNPRVREINLSHTDALPEGERMGPLYERIGFTRCGGIYRRDTLALSTKEAAA